MTKDGMLKELLRALLAEGWEDSRTAIPEDAAGQRHLLRTLMNIRPPLRAHPELLALQDRFLAVERASAAVTDPHRLPSIRQTFGAGDVPCQDQLLLWRGGITTLAADAIVNAANSKLLGCFVPHHRCIDNAIHSAAGIQLRLECHRIMQRQGGAEPVGQAKLTGGYNLPARYVIHTVGPTIHGSVRPEDERLLECCYTACLDLAAQHQDIKVLAFCCISTGEFRFPKLPAAQIAVRTVCRWLQASGHHLHRVVFNVFTQEDHDVYAALFRQS
jgi:O-acetyl-ADP-ribose deacetylase (regulator of RNase III)